MAHFILGYDGPCFNIHGHTWRFEVLLGAEGLGPTGFVADFSFIKNVILKPVHALLDHSLIMSDRIYVKAEELLAELGRLLLFGGGLKDSASSKISSSRCTLILNRAFTRASLLKIATFPFDPTCERLAEWFYYFAASKFPDGSKIQVSSVRVYEKIYPAAFCEYSE
jgi:6-pyruvoyl-tetrahydropterin synthase